MEDCDEFAVVGPIPRGRAYQWAALSILGNYELCRFHNLNLHANGWRPVPARRHPRMPRNERGHIVVGSQILLERSAKAAREARRREEQTARDMHAESPGGRGKWHLITPQPGVSPPSAQAKQEAIDALGNLNGRRYARFTVEIGLTLSDSEIDTALNALALTLSEYARRKFLMAAHALLQISGHVMDSQGTKVFDVISLKPEEV